MTRERLQREMDAKLQVPGMPNVWWMPIQTRTEMLSTGVRSPLGIQVYGNDLDQIETAAIEIERVLATVPGTRSAFADRATGGFYIDVVIKRAEAARHGLTAEDINDVVETAIGGMEVSQTIEGRERYPINVRYPRELRDDPSALERILVATPMGAQVPLGQVAEILTVTGPPMIRSEDGKLVGLVLVDTDRPLADYVHDAQQAVAQRVDLAGRDRERVGRAVSALRASQGQARASRPDHAVDRGPPAVPEHPVARRDRRSCCSPCRSRWSARSGCSTCSTTT
jgi:Cu(I)/Ag(I) efflux system membrane protein CusA/SilA